jgi:CDP-diacylglycerol--serine O-phosphatidyltransferase
MAKLNNPINKKLRTDIEGRPRKQRLRYISVFPSLITLMNGIFGYVAISFTSRAASLERPLNPWFGITFFAMAGYMIFLAMVADMLDGSVARLSKSTTSFGGQLDSLSDAISFGVAPAFLMMKVMELKVRSLSFNSPFLRELVLKTIGLCAVIYVCGTIIRLARFNVENKEDESAHMSFSGLPSPAAAGLIVSLVIFQQDFLPRIFNRYEGTCVFLESLIYCILPLIALSAAILMVTRVRYPHIVNVHFRGKKSFPSFIGAFFAVLLVAWNIQLAAVIGFLGYTLWGIVRAGILILRKKKTEEGAESSVPLS